MERMIHNVFEECNCTENNCLMFLCWLLGGIFSEEVAGHLTKYRVVCRTSRQKDKLSRIFEATMKKEEEWFWKIDEWNRKRLS